MEEKKQKCFVSDSGVSLGLQAIANVNALQSLMAEAGIFDRALGIEMAPSELINRVKDWNRLFSYVVMNGITDNPEDGDIDEVEALGFRSKSKNVMRLNWIRYGKKEGIDILTSQEEAARLVMEILQLTFSSSEDDSES